MSKQKIIFLWDKYLTAQVAAHKLVEIRIIPTTTISGEQVYRVNGWLNKNESFCFGDFFYEAEAQDFINRINAELERKQQKEK